MTDELKTIKAIFIPTFAQGVLSFLGAIIILVTMHGNLLLALVAKTAYVPQENLGFVVSDQLAKLSQVPFAERFAVGLFWAVVASIVYVLAVTANNALIAARNEIVIDTTFVNNSRRGWSLLNRLVIRLAWGLVLIGGLLLTTITLLPTWLNWFSSSINPDAALAPWWYMVLAVVGLSVNIYFLWIFLRAAIAGEA